MGKIRKVRKKLVDSKSKCSIRVVRTKAFMVATEPVFQEFPHTRALPSTGSISMSQVNVELRRPSNEQKDFNNADVRKLAGAPSGAISMAMLRGKSWKSGFTIGTRRVDSSDIFYGRSAHHGYGSIERPELIPNGAGIIELYVRSYGPSFTIQWNNTPFPNYANVTIGPHTIHLPKHPQAINTYYAQKNGEVSTMLNYLRSNVGNTLELSIVGG